LPPAPARGAGGSPHLTHAAPAVAPLPRAWPFTRATAQHAQFRAAQDSLTAELEAILRQGHCNGFGVAIMSSQGVRYQHRFGLADVQAHKVYDSHTIHYRVGFQNGGGHGPAQGAGARPAQSGRPR
jgi:hypothetical protein